MGSASVRLEFSHFGGAFAAVFPISGPRVEIQFYTRSSLVREKNNVAPANKLSSVLSYFGGTQSAWWLILLALHFALITVVHFFVFVGAAIQSRVAASVSPAPAAKAGGAGLPPYVAPPT